MTTLESVPCGLQRAVSELQAVEKKGQSYVAQILDAHQKVLSAERSGYRQSLDAAIAAGKLLLDAKEAIKGQFNWTDWREEHLGQISQPTASRYMRLAKNEDRLKKPDLSTEGGRKISLAVTNLAKDGELSIRKAAALLVEHKPRGKPPAAKTEEAKHKDWLHDLEAADLVLVLKEIHGAHADDYLKELATALAPPIERRV